MAKRPATHLRVGGGELVPPGANARAQWLFLEAVRGCVPEAMRALAEIALELPDDDRPARPNYQREAPLRRWCEDWGFTGIEQPRGHHDWLLSVARRTADWMRTSKRKTKTWVFMYSHFEPDTEQVTPLQWNPAQETESHFRGRLDTYIRHVRARAKEQGWLDPPEKRTLEHIEWLARYQVGRWTQARIAQHWQDEQGKPDIPAVSRALKKTAAVVGLRLRKAQGRPQEP